MRWCFLISVVVFCGCGMAPLGAAAERSMGGPPPTGVKAIASATEADGNLPQAGDFIGDDAGAADDAEEPAADDGEAGRSGRIMIYTARFTLAVHDVTSTRKRVAELAKDANGYLQEETQESITIRVPAARFTEVAEKVKRLGRIRSQHILGKDVTEEYIDIGLRLRALKKHLERLEQLLSKAQNVEETLAIMKQIRELTEKIETLEGRLRYLKNRAAFSTIIVTLEPVTREAKEEYVFESPFHWVREICIERIYRNAR